MFLYYIIITKILPHYPLEQTRDIFDGLKYILSYLEKLYFFINIFNVVIKSIFLVSHEETSWLEEPKPRVKTVRKCKCVTDTKPCKNKTKKSSSNWVASDSAESLKTATMTEEKTIGAELSENGMKEEHGNSAPVGDDYFDIGGLLGVTFTKLSN